jgi:hypothetical protein
MLTIYVNTIHTFALIILTILGIRCFYKFAGVYMWVVRTWRAQLLTSLGYRVQVAECKSYLFKREGQYCKSSWVFSRFQGKIVSKSQDKQNCSSQSL